MESVYAVSTNVYEVWIRNDSNSNDLMWFNFRMRNLNGFSGKIKIKIVNISRDANVLQCVSSSVLYNVNFRV